MTYWRSGPLGDALCTPPASRPAGKWAVMGRESAKITQNRPFLPQYRPDMAMIWSHMASIPMSISHTTSTSPMCPPPGRYLGRNGPRHAPNQSNITQNKAFLHQYRPDIVIIWSHMVSIPMALSHTTHKSHIHPCIGHRGPGRAISIVKIHQKSLKSKHF